MSCSAGLGLRYLLPELLEALTTAACILPMWQRLQVKTTEVLCLSPSVPIFAFLYVFQLVFGLAIPYYQFFNQAFKMFFKFSPAVLVAFSERADLSNQAHHTTQIFSNIFYYHLAFKKLGKKLYASYLEK